MALNQTIPPFIATINDLESYARLPALSRNLAMTLVQGFKPLSLNRPDICCLDEHWPHVQQLKEVENKGKLKFPCTPRKLVEVCAEMDIPLPEPFVEKVLAGMPAIARPSKLMRLTEEWIIIPTEHAKKPAPTGKIVHGIDPAIAKAARDLILEHIRRKGHYPFKKEIDRELRSAFPHVPRFLYSLHGVCTAREVNAAKRKFRSTRYEET